MKHFDAAENGALVDFYSPIPPIRSGTADYFDEVLRRVLRVPGVARYLRIVVSKDDLGSDVPDAYQGVQVIDERLVSPQDHRFELAVRALRLSGKPGFQLAWRDWQIAMR